MSISKILLEEGDSNQVAQRQEWNETLSEHTQRMIEEDARYFLHQALSSPCMNVVAKAQGECIYDADGREYLDFHGNSVHQVGFGNHYVATKVKEVMDKLPFSPRRFANEYATACARKLIEITPNGLEKLLFTPAGTLSIGLALKIARMVTGRHKVVSMYDAFHGASLDSISVGGEHLFRGGLGPLMTGTILVPPYDSYRGFMGLDKYGDEEMFADYIEYVIRKEGDVGALLAEPIRSTVVHIPTEKFWRKVRQICDDNGVLLIFDEIPTALGRTGEMFACQGFGVTPDILVLGKGLAAGFAPFAATICRAEYDVAADRALGHYTFEKNPIASVAALSAIEFIENNNIIEKVKKMGEMVRSRLTNMMLQSDAIGDVRGKGLLWAIELVEDCDTKRPAMELASRVMYRCQEKGLSFKVSSGNILTLVPALTISENQMNGALDIIEAAIIKG